MLKKLKLETIFSKFKEQNFLRLSQESLDQFECIFMLILNMTIKFKVQTFENVLKIYSTVCTLHPYERSLSDKDNLVDHLAYPRHVCPCLNVFTFNLATTTKSASDTFDP